MECCVMSHSAAFRNRQPDSALSHLSLPVNSMQTHSSQHRIPRLPYAPGHHSIRLSGKQLRGTTAMKERDLYSIREARERLGGISQNTIYQLLRSGALVSVVIGCRRFISSAAISELIARSTTQLSPAHDPARLRKSDRSLPSLLQPLVNRSRRRSSPL